MKKVRFLYSILCLGIILVMTSCGGPAKDTPRATVSEAKPIVEEAPAPSSEPENPAEPAPAAAAPSSEPVAVSPAPVAVSPAPAAATPAPGATARTFTITPDDSSLGFMGYNLLGGRECGFSNFGGKVVLQGDNIETMRIDAAIEMASVFSDHSDLTPALKGEKGFFEVDQFPKSTFKSTSVAKSDKGFTVTGNLNLRGVEKSISFPATIAVNEKELTAKADFVLNRQDFGISYKGTGDFAVKDEVDVKIEIHATS